MLNILRGLLAAAILATSLETLGFRRAAGVLGMLIAGLFAVFLVVYIERSRRCLD